MFCVAENLEQVACTSYLKVNESPCKMKTEIRRFAVSDLHIGAVYALSLMIIFQTLARSDDLPIESKLPVISKYGDNSESRYLFCPIW